MRLILVRHAKAAPGDPDALRPLTADGRTQARELAERLAPGATTAAVRAAVEGRGERIVVVGHQPDCGRIAAELTGGTEPPFPAAGMCVVDLA